MVASRRYGLLQSLKKAEESMARTKISTTVYITEQQNERLKQLNKKTKVPVSEYIREGIDLVLEKHRDKLPGQISLVEPR
jgi:predicted DNA-binding protein